MTVKRRGVASQPTTPASRAVSPPVAEGPKAVSASSKGDSSADASALASQENSKLPKVQEARKESTQEPKAELKDGPTHEPKAQRRRRQWDTAPAQQVPWPGDKSCL